MAARLAAAAGRRPRSALVLLGLFVLVTGFYGSGAADRLGLSEGTQTEPALIAVPAVPAGAAAYRVAASTIVAQVSSSADVRAVRATSSHGGRQFRIAIRLDPGLDSGERQQAIGVIGASIDPGPMRVQAVGGESTLRVVRDNSEREGSRVVPAALIAAALLLLAAFGAWTALGITLSAACALTGMLGCARIADRVLDLHATGLIAAAAIGLALAIELGIRLSAPARAGAAAAGPRSEPTLSTLGFGALAAVLVAAGAALVPLGYMRSAALCGALAAAFAAGASVIALAAVEALAGPGTSLADARRSAINSFAELVAWSRPTATLLGALSALILAVLALPLLTVVVLPPVSGSVPGSPDLLETMLGGLPIAVAVAAAAAIVTTGLAGRMLLPALLAPLALLPAAAGAGVAALIFGDGNLHNLLGYDAAGGVHLAPLALGAVAVAVLAVARWSMDARAARDLGPASGRRTLAMLESGLPPALGSCILLAVVGASLLFAEPTFAKELGVTLAAGSLLDLAAIQILLAPAILALAGSRERRPHLVKS